MTYSLTQELEQLIRAKVDSGRYHSADEVVREGLRLLEQRDQQLGEWRSKLQAGVDQADAGDAAPLDIGDVIATAKAERSNKATP